MSQNQNDEGGAERAAGGSPEIWRVNFNGMVKGWELRAEKAETLDSPAPPGAGSEPGEQTLIPGIVGHRQPLDVSPAAPSSLAGCCQTVFSVSPWPLCLVRLCLRRKGWLHCSA